MSQNFQGYSTFFVGEESTIQLCSEQVVSLYPKDANNASIKVAKRLPSRVHATQ